MPKVEMSWSEVAAEGDIKAIREIAGFIADRSKCRVISEPSPGMVMVRHTDPLECAPFYMGEAFVTQCEVQVDDCAGFGCILGNEPDRALCAGLIDAVLGNGHPLSGAVKELLRKEAEAVKAAREAENRLIAGTKVNFETRKA